MTVDAPALAGLSDLHFGYSLPDGGRREVLRGMNLSLERGEMVALVGPNGSGKTTLLRLLTGQLTADRGTASFDGRPVAGWRRDALARKVAVLPQQIELPVGFRVAELVEMGRAPHARSLFGSTAEDERAVRTCPG